MNTTSVMYFCFQIKYIFINFSGDSINFTIRIKLTTLKKNLFLEITFQPKIGHQSMEWVIQIVVGAVAVYKDIRSEVSTSSLAVLPRYKKIGIFDHWSVANPIHKLSSLKSVLKVYTQSLSVLYRNRNRKAETETEQK